MADAGPTGAPPTTTPLLEPSLVVDGVGMVFTQRRQSFEALRDVSLSAHSGEFVSIVGRSGCGKSTLFNVAAGLLHPTTGRVVHQGTDCTGRPGFAGYMLQRDHLLPSRRLLDNICLGRDVLRHDRKASRRMAADLLPRFGLAGFERAYPSELSGGMRQRAALLRTILLERDLLLLDEPFGALDAITRFDMQTWLLSIWDEFRRTVLFITHDVEEAVYLSDRVLVMDGPPGVIVADIAVPIERPRAHSDVVTSVEFAEIKHQLLELIGRNTP